jgi:predicted Na+-dependent transporter
MVLLMVFTIAYMPLVLPLLLQGISVDPWSIARPLILLMLLPLTIGLFTRMRFSEIASVLHPYLERISTFALILLIASGLLAHMKAVIGVFSSSGIIALLLFLALAFVFGYLLGGKDSSIRSVLGLGTAQRNLSAALVIATANFTDNPDVIVMVLVLGLVDLTTLLISANYLGRRKNDQQLS